jgi:hypothetical protein
MRYVISEEIEYDWTTWGNDDCPYAWERLQEQIYKMCFGIARKFRPKDDEEHTELAHEAFVLTMDKIKDRRLTFDDRAPVFNLLTTTIFRHLFSLKNRDSRRRNAMNKYAKRVLSNPDTREQLSHVQLNHIWNSLSSIE